jgi:MFS transporter, putative metabolite:H+ symporter
MDSKASASPATAASIHLENLQIPQRIERLPLTSYQRFLGFIIITAWFFDCVDLGAMTFLLPVLAKEFQLSPVMMGTLVSMSFCGMLVGTALSGLLSDKFGRKKILQWSMVLWGVAGILCALSWDITSLFVFRFLLGLGLGAELPVAHATLPEFLPKNARGRYVAIMEGLLPVGIIVAGLITYFVLPFVGWRWVFVAEAVPAAWLFVIRRNIHESPRWLEAVGRREEADRVMTEIEATVSKKYGKPLPPVLEQTLVEKETGQAPFVELWSSDYWKRTLMLWIVWPACLFGYYGLTSWLGALLVGKGFAVIKSITFVVTITLGGIPGFLSATYLIEKLGRKPVVIVATAMTAVSAYFYGNAGTMSALYMWGFAMMFFTYAMWSSIYAYTPELYPTRMRGTGCGLSSSVGRIGAIAGPYAIGWLLVSAGAGAVFTMAASMFGIAALAVLVLGPETQGRILEEISQ